MASGPYETILQEVGELLHAGELEPDNHNTCLLQMESGLEVHIEMADRQDAVLLAASLGALTPGPYRDDIFRAALITNGQEPPHNGVLGFSDEANELIIYDLIPLEDINGDRIVERLAAFEEKAVKWKASLENNEVPVVSQVGTSRRMGGMFGL